MKSFCQITSVTLLLALAGCAVERHVLPDGDAIMNQPKPAWFSTRKSIRLAGLSGEPQPHLFYDADPEWALNAREINFLPTSVAGHSPSYALDVLSGQRHFSHFTCAQPDVNGQRSVPSVPSFTRGVIPRTLDQTNNPQEILVFGDAGRFSTNAVAPMRVRVVGGLVLKECPVGACTGPRDWIGRLLLLAVDPLDARLGKVTDLPGLLDSVSWEDVRAQLENHAGRNRIGDQNHPAVRASAPVGVDEVVKHFTTHAVRFSADELNRLQKSCAKLYARLWRDVGVPRTADAPATDAAAVSARSKLLADARAKGVPVLFHERLARFLAQDATELATCGRLVYPGDPNGRAERFWFTSWLTTFVRLHREGHVFDCRSGEWAQAPSATEALAGLKKFTCTGAKMDKAIRTLSTYLRGLEVWRGERWRFVTWDDGAQGSHAKLYSWVRVPARAFACEADPNARVRTGWTDGPEAHTWSERAEDAKGRGDGAVIY
jgi:hypothetical protein